MLYQSCIGNWKVKYFEHKSSKHMRCDRHWHQNIFKNEKAHKIITSLQCARICAGIFAELTQDMRMVFLGMSPQDIAAIQIQLTSYIDLSHLCMLSNNLALHFTSPCSSLTVHTASMSVCSWVPFWTVTANFLSGKLQLGIIYSKVNL